MASARLRPPCLPPKGKRVRIQNFARPAGEWDEANESPRHNHQRSGSTGSPLIGSCDAARLRTCFRWDSSCANASNAQRGSRRKSAAKLEWLFGIANRTPGPRPIADVTAPEILQVLRAVEARKRRETAKRLRAVIGSVFLLPWPLGARPAIRRLLCEERSPLQ